MLERWLDVILPLLRRRYIVIELHWESCKLFVDWQ
jgi:hypothetical protein